MSETLTDLDERLQSENPEQAEKVKNGTDRAISLFGGRVHRIIVNDLSKHGSNVAGVFHKDSKKIEVDREFAEQATENQITHVISHEIRHYDSDMNGNNCEYDDDYSEEGLTEMAAAKADGQETQTYFKEQGKVISLIRKTGLSVNKAIDLHINNKEELESEFQKVRQAA